MVIPSVHAQVGKIVTKSEGSRLRKQLKKEGYSDKAIEEILKWYLG